MLTPLPFSTRTLGRYLLAAPLVVLLALSAAPARAQVVPTPAPPMKPAPSNGIYYIDGKLSSSAELAKIDLNTIGSINIIKGAKQQQLFGNSTADGVAVVTTTTNASSPAVLAFNKRISDVVPLTPATPAQNSAVAAIKAYLTKTYPTAQLEMVGPAKEQPGRYRAVFKENDQRLQLLFDDQGQPVQE